MPLRLQAVTFDAADPGRLGRFWAELLGREVVETSLGVLLPGDDAQLGLRFAPESGAARGPNRMHLHLTSASEADQQQTVAKAIRLGARHLDVGQSPDEGHVVCADPGGNAFCVIEPDNAFLAGCGVLGELACEGTRELGLFWSAALAWPLVWDQDQETAIQSPEGGTKVAWGGPPVPPIPAHTNPRLDLTSIGNDRESEADRLVSLGARVDVGGAPDAPSILVDPDGNEFRLLVE
jgi:hypothetical protein